MRGERSRSSVKAVHRGYNIAAQQIFWGVTKGVTISKSAQQPLTDICFRASRHLWVSNSLTGLTNWEQTDRVDRINEINYRLLISCGATNHPLLKFRRLPKKETSGSEKTIRTGETSLPYSPRCHLVLSQGH